MISLTTHPYNCYYQREKPRVSSGGQRTPLVKSQAVLKSHLKTYLLLSQRFLGRPSTFPLVSLYLNFPTVQLPSSWRHFEGMYRRAETPLDWPCIKKFQFYNKLKSTNWCLKPRTSAVAEEFVATRTVLPCATVLMSVREHNSEWKNSSSSTLYKHLTWLGMLSLSRIEKQICSLDFIFSEFLEFKVSFYFISTGFDDCCVYICSQINKFIHLHMLRYGKESKNKTCPTPLQIGPTAPGKQKLSGSPYLHWWLGVIRKAESI